jgi:hypothetical protein
MVDITSERISLQHALGFIIHLYADSAIKHIIDYNNNEDKYHSKLNTSELRRAESIFQINPSYQENAANYKQAISACIQNSLNFPRNVIYFHFRSSLYS